MKKLLFALLFATACMAQGDKPKPLAAPPKPVIRRTNDWESVTLTAGLAGAELYDGISTKKAVNDCLSSHAFAHCGENDPISRLVLTSRPTWPRMIAFGTLEAAGAHLLARKMRQSPNRWARRFWWAPQAALIGVHLSQGVGNFSRAADYRSRLTILARVSGRIL